MNRYWTLAARPLDPWPTPETFELRQAPIPEPGPGQALTRTIYVSLDPYQWGYKKRGVEPVGAPCHARTVAQVTQSRMEGFSPGDLVFNTNGWSQYGLMGEGVPRPGYMIPRKLDPAQGRISQAVGVLGMLGLTAYAGMILQADPKPGDTAVVSAASGGVGQIAGRTARPAERLRVVGASPWQGEEKCCFRDRGAGLRRLRLAPVADLRRRPRRRLPQGRRRLFRERRRRGVRRRPAAVQPRRPDDHLRPDRPLRRRGLG